MNYDQFLEQARQSKSLEFSQVMAVIDDQFAYSATAFSNGLADRKQQNEAGQNEGSCKLLAFARICQFNQQQTLNLFGEHYRDVLSDPDGVSHQNIRAFMVDGWDGVCFDAEPLKRKS